MPNVKWALLYGVILCNARAMGEFGAVSVVSGHIRGLTNTMPLQVEILTTTTDFVAAFAVASSWRCSRSLRWWSRRRGMARGRIARAYEHSRRGVSKRFKQFVALDDVDLECPPASSSRCWAVRSGKTTLLRIIAGLEFADAGRIPLRGRTSANRPPGNAASASFSNTTRSSGT